MKNYEEMSDGEITWRVHHVYNEVPDGYATICVADYCNSPSDAWPIIVENGISLVTIGNEWEAHWFSIVTIDEEFNTKCKNPLRAAMICFLKMKDAEK